MDKLPLPDGVSHVVTLAEYARVGGELESARAERDRLAVECKELREKISALEAVSNGYQTAMWEATAALDALREAVPTKQQLIDEADRLERINDAERIDDYAGILEWMHNRIDAMNAILRPKESFRDKAARHGFAPMPPELSQQTIDGETNYVAHPLQNLADAQVPPVPEFDAVVTEHFWELTENDDDDGNL